MVDSWSNQLSVGNDYLIEQTYYDDLEKTTYEHIRLGLTKRPPAIRWLRTAAAAGIIWNVIDGLWGVRHTTRRIKH